MRCAAHLHLMFVLGAFVIQAPETVSLEIDIDMSLARFAVVRGWVYA